ncbi:MAG: hypothetical protein Q4F31_01500 [Eubacteriales bacterium]|nr:hypothetical protein [Eubacteriales bacterium]
MNLAIWLFVFACIFLLSRYMQKKEIGEKYVSVLIFLSVAMIFIQTSGLISSVISMPEADYENAGYLSADGEYTLSSENNVIVFVVDACSGAYMEQALADQPDMLDDFDGFTYYPDCISTYSRTYPSIVYLLSGKRCYYDVPFNEYLISAFGESTFLSDMKNIGADVRVFTDPIYFDGEARNQIDNFRTFNGKSLDIIRPYVLIKQMLHISGYKCMPYLFKTRFEYNIIILNHLVRKDPSDIAIEFQDYDFYTNFEKDGLTLYDNYSDSFRLYHLWGPHGDCFIDENVNLLEDVEPVRALRGTFKIISAFINEMKSLKIYDASTIIILADHGNSYGNSELEIDEEKSCLMLVKPAGQNGAVQVSEAPVSHENFFSTVLSAYGIDDENFSVPEVYNVSEDSTEPRYYYYDARFSDGNGVIASREYRIDGDARDFSSYSLTGNYWDINFSQDHLSETRLSEFLAENGK